MTGAQRVELRILAKKRKVLAVPKISSAGKNGRELDDDRRLSKDLPDRCKEKPLFAQMICTVTGTVLIDLLHELSPLALTGKSGRP